MKTVRILPKTVVIVTAYLLCSLTSIVLLIGNYKSWGVAIFIAIIGILLTWRIIDVMTPSISSEDIEAVGNDSSAIHQFGILSILKVAMIPTSFCNLFCYVDYFRKTENMTFVVILALIECLALHTMSEITIYSSVMVSNKVWCESLERKSKHREKEKTIEEKSE